ncbi:MAG: hypothetical protein ACON5K_08960 [Bacteroidia bacterium]
MSIVAIAVGLPIPIINLVATFIFFLAQRKATYFVRWHSVQALLSQMSLLILNSKAWYWTYDVVFTGESAINNEYVAYLIAVVLINLVEFFATLYAASKVRKGIDIRFWFFSDLTDTFVNK